MDGIFVFSYIVIASRSRRTSGEAWQSHQDEIASSLCRVKLGFAPRNDTLYDYVLVII